jgi:hypothetical protein
LVAKNDWMGYSIRTANLKTESLLINYPELSKYVICATET